MTSKFLIQALSAAALTLGAMGAAHADQTGPVLLPPVFGTGLNQSESFSDTFTTAGSFSDFFIFSNAPSFSLDTYTANGTGLTFTSVTLTPYMDTDPIALNTTLTATSITASPATALPSAVYMLEIQGVATAGASFTGKINSLATDAPIPPTPVPEPTTLALMLGGLGLMGFLARRRRQA